MRQAADAALLEVAQMESRLRTEQDSIRRYCEQETSRLQRRNEILSEQLADAVRAAAELQEC